MLTRTAKIVIGIALIPILGLAILLFPLILILGQDLVGAIINPPFSHCEVMDKAQLEAALKKGFKVSAGCCSDHMIVECSIARPNSNPLLFAIENGNLEAMQLLLDHGADVNQDSSYGYALAEAAKLGRTDMVAPLLARGI